jgi:peptide-methionine (S)-S-oxide reductase
LYAEALDGSDVVSTNAYLTASTEELRPCEMPAAKVLDFLQRAGR